MRTRLEVGKAQYCVDAHQAAQDHEWFWLRNRDFAGGRLCREAFYTHSHLTVKIADGA